MTEGENLPEEYDLTDTTEQGTKREGPSGHLIRAEAVYMRQGPLPEAHEMEHYERVLPGSADRILSMAENEVSHRHTMDSRGQIIGTGLPVFFILLGAVVFLISGSWASVVLAGLGLTPAGYNFLRAIVANGRQRNGD